MYMTQLRSLARRAGIHHTLAYVTGDEGTRTLDLRIANATLSQLSYVPTIGRAYVNRRATAASTPDSPDGGLLMAAEQRWSGIPVT